MQTHWLAHRNSARIPRTRMLLLLNFDRALTHQMFISVLVPSYGESCEKRD